MEAAVFADKAAVACADLSAPPPPQETKVDKNVEHLVTIEFSAMYDPVGFMVCNQGKASHRMHCGKCLQFLGDATGKMSKRVAQSTQGSYFCRFCFTRAEVDKAEAEVDTDSDDESRSNDSDVDSHCSDPPAEDAAAAAVE